MHMLFTEEELSWIQKNEFGWPIKKGCPAEIRKSIEKKMEKINSQAENDKKLKSLH